MYSWYFCQSFQYRLVMMFSPIIQIICFAFVLYKNAEAAVGIFPPEDKPPEIADQEGCFLSSLGFVLDVGVPYSPVDGENCQQYICNENGNTQLFTCGAKAVSKGCKEIDGDKTLTYPECCNIVRCTNGDGTYTDF